MSAELATVKQPNQEQFAFSEKTNLVQLNEQFRMAKPSEIMKFTIEHAKNPVIFTNFRPLAVAFLHLVTQPKPDIPVIWVDHGFNTPETYRHIERVVARLNLNLIFRFIHQGCQRPTIRPFMDLFRRWRHLSTIVFRK